ncbi:hypothetical protein EV2_009275 [Malus domestica]
MWTEHGMVRYSNNLIFEIEKEDAIKFVPSPNPAKDSAQFNLVLNPLLSTLIEKAASGDSTKKFTAGHATVPGGETIHALVQCTPNINQLNCSHCLTEAVSDIPDVVVECKEEEFLNRGEEDDEQRMFVGTLTSFLTRTSGCLVEFPHIEIGIAMEYNVGSVADNMEMDNFSTTKETDDVHGNVSSNRT